MTAAAIGSSAAALVVTLILASGQWDGGRVTFPAESGVDVTLDRGERRIVYMTAGESAPMNFDFYASDFDCAADGPDGLVSVRREHESRLLDLWRRHTAIGSVAADSAGTYRISCRGKGDVPLVVAAPARFTLDPGYASSPRFAVMVLVSVLVASAVIHGVRRLRTVSVADPA